jgi:hypothetical protein
VKRSAYVTHKGLTPNMKVGLVTKMKSQGQPTHWVKISDISKYYSHVEECIIFYLRHKILENNSNLDTWYSCRYIVEYVGTYDEVNINLYSFMLLAGIQVTCDD